MQAQRTLRVGILIDRWQPSRGGAERALSQLAQHLEQRGHEVHAFSERGPHRDEPAPGRLHLVRAARLALTRGARERALDDAARTAAEEARCNVTIGVRHVRCVDLYWPHGGSHARSVAAWRAARAWREDASPAGADSKDHTGPRFVPHLYGRHRAFVQFERDLLEGGGARSVACVSDLVARELADDFPGSRERLSVVRNGVDLERYHPRCRLTSGARLCQTLGLDMGIPLIVFVARQPVLKGLPVLLAALARSKEPWNLVVAGVSDPGAWSRRAESAGLDVRRMRIVREVDAAALLSAADLCVLPTWRDTSGLVVLEALACGTPVITTTRAGECGVVSSDVGHVLQPGDASALAAAISHWLGRVRTEEIDRDAVRARVADRGLAPWLDRIEALLLDLAR
jgi:glycosyltransferase involved in cell wall biosynthesis